MNYHSNWYSVRNVLEYYFWFRSRLHFHAAQRFIPLGGNTVFVRADLLREAGGWDPDCLAEDCGLGVRLSSAGPVAVAYDPELVTREETPGTLRAFLKQRTRWNQGFLQVLRKGEWRRLPTTRQRLLARYTLATPFLQAFIGPLVPLSLLAVLLLKVPVLAALISFLPLTPTLMVVVVEVVGLGEFCRAYGFRPHVRDYLRLVLGPPSTTCSSPPPRSVPSPGSSGVNEGGRRPRMSGRTACPPATSPHRSTGASDRSA